MAAGWSTEATKALLSLSGEGNIQSQLNGVVRNKPIHGRVEESMCELGYIFTCSSRSHTYKGFDTGIKAAVC